MALPLSGILFFYLSITLQQSSFAAQNSGKITVGQSLLANVNGNNSILSPSGDFAFGFHQLAKNTNNHFLVAIWYAKIPDTIVWYANEGNPVPQGSKLTVKANEGLVLSDSQGTELWNNTGKLPGGVALSYGYLNDTGNFVLKSGSSDAAPVWQSFDYPTDTLLPTQVLGRELEVDSRMFEANLTKGRFQLRLLKDGNLVLNTRDLQTGFAYGAYYESGTNDATNPENAGEQLIYSASGNLYILRQNKSKFNLITMPEGLLSASSNYLRVTLDYDGLLTWYFHPRNSTGNNGGGWYTIQAIPDNICTSMQTYGGDFDSGACGYNSICSIDLNGRPKCQCPPNYSVMSSDDMNSRIGSCEPDFKLQVCENSGSVSETGEYTLVRIQNTDWPLADYARLMPCSEEECMSSCLKDCFCAAAIYDGISSCWKKKLPLSNGKHDSSVQRIAWLKVGNRNESFVPISPFPPPRNVKNKLNAATTGLLSGSVCVNLIFLGAICFGIFLMRNRKQAIGFDARQSRIVEHNAVHSFSYKELEYATNEFEEEIGRGAFGVVYKGRIGSGDNPIVIAVKKLDRNFKGADKEFAAEVNVIGQTHHKNLVRFIGFCKEEDERLLVYEYMTNGTVADYLFGDVRPSWMARSHIAHGIARGLLYLHEECSTQIIHCDIKPQNILIDDHYNARIADFGLAKLLVLDQNHTHTAVRGTKGYLAPEWFKNKPVSVKVDVYSFGVLLLEIICCRRSVSMEFSAENPILTDWAFDCYQTGMLDSLVDSDIEALADRLQLERFIKVALWCVQENPNLRPTMKKVTQILEGVAEVHDPPCQASFSVTTQV